MAELLTDALAAAMHRAGVDALLQAEDGMEDEDSLYCGCSDCVVRTVLEGVWPLVEQAATDVRASSSGLRGCVELPLWEDA